MISHEYLEHLLEMNGIERELRRPSVKGRKRTELEERMVALKTKLPTALVTHHERMAWAGRESVAALSSTSSCGGCHMKVPVGMQADLNRSGRIAVCPHCGIFLFKAEAAVAAAGR